MSTLMLIYDKLYAAFGAQRWWPGQTPFEIALGAILTQNTNWENVRKAISNLREADCLTVERLYDMPQEQLAQFLRPSGYFNVKTRRVMAFIGFLVKNYDGDIENMRPVNTSLLRQQLLSIHGIGPETADSILLYALDRPVFVIDTYTKRALSRHNVLDFKRSYDEFQQLFYDALPGDLQIYNEYHALLVKTGKLYCKPKPLCYGNSSIIECPLLELDSCR
ncbi:HhH-GPD family protein [Candidatus Magnetobacterium bavaricum]|uniref:HhH-GPD family protein n=1 Tax=Candidatus Magnetobacterium bavaricum TaxID=29290 RepID=A0A0F3GWI9_9BACT|nr:HhH-GPD family protein [Candidatus Magnetobacterium bavaricum]